MNKVDDLDAIRERLVVAGLSEDSILHSTGITGHLDCLKAGAVALGTLERYADDLEAIREITQQYRTPIPIDFWDVNSVMMQSKHVSQYDLAHTLNSSEYRPYVELLARCFQYLADFQQLQQTTAVNAALLVLRECCRYVSCKNCVSMTAFRPHLSPEQQAIFLWQQILTGTNRQIPYIHRDAYTHSYWNHFNVIEMWRYYIRKDVSVDEVWGLSGFDDYYIREARNTNQIEHMAISALAQRVLNVPLFALTILEEMEWILRKGGYAECQGDKALNRAIARYFLPLFNVNDPQPACDSLERILAIHPK